MAYTLIRLLHLGAILVLAGTLVIQNMAVGRHVNGEDARNLAKVNKVYGMAAGIATLLGLILWLLVGKPAAFYNTNPVFHTKLGLVVLLAILSIGPTRFLERHLKSGEETIPVPIGIRLTLRLELLILAIIPVLAYLMARGIGVSG